MKCFNLFFFSCYSILGNHSPAGPRLDASPSLPLSSLPSSHRYLPPPSAAPASSVSLQSHLARPRHPLVQSVSHRGFGPTPVTSDKPSRHLTQSWPGRLDTLSPASFSPSYRRRPAAVSTLFLCTILTLIYLSFFFHVRLAFLIPFFLRSPPPIIIRSRDLGQCSPSKQYHVRILKQCYPPAAAAATPPPPPT